MNLQEESCVLTPDYWQTLARVC